MSEHAFTARFGPSRASVHSITRWARAHRLRVVSVSANRTLVRLSGSPRALGAALGTHLHRFSARGVGDYRAPTRPARLPRPFGPRVAGVLGLNSLGRLSLSPHRSGVHPHAGGLAVPSAYGPRELANLYDAGSSASGSGQPLAVIAEGDVSQPQRDLVTFEQRFGLPQVPWTTTRVGAPSSDTAGNDEWDLDTQYSTGLAPDASSVRVYAGASLSNDDILATINKWVTDNAARQASFSAGECESLAYLTGFTSGLDTVLAQAQAQGQTLFTSSGDTGSFCPAGPAGVNGVPAGAPGVEYPASSPGAIGVGGTTVLGSGPNEIAWYAGGGGSAFFEPAPSWQSGAGGSFLGVRRGVPDVSLDADPVSGYRVIVDGTEQTIGGTSASAPAWQGIWARAQSAHGGSLGFAGPVIYKTAPPSAFHDILVGHQGVYPATPGWDYDTGRGTPDIAAFVAGA
jgi:subtilase family serine protease